MGGAILPPFFQCHPPPPHPPSLGFRFPFLPPPLPVPAPIFPSGPVSGAALPCIINSNNITMPCMIPPLCHLCSALLCQATLNKLPPLIQGIVVFFLFVQITGQPHRGQGGCAGHAVRPLVQGRQDHCLLQDQAACPPSQDPLWPGLSASCRRAAW